jgi:hypothetical protein
MFQDIFLGHEVRSTRSSLSITLFFCDEVFFSILQSSLKNNEMAKTLNNFFFSIFSKLIIVVVAKQLCHPNKSYN